jgi:hypothetical protein
VVIQVEHVVPVVLLIVGPEYRRCAHRTGVGRHAECDGAEKKEDLFHSAENGLPD